MTERITTEIPIIKIDPDADGPDFKMETLTGNIYPFSKQTMTYEEALVSLEDFGAGETFTWFYAEPEVQYILKGKAKMTYSLGGTSHTERITVEIGPGDCYIIPTAARITWEVDPSGPLRKFCVLMPFYQRATPKTYSTLSKLK